MINNLIERYPSLESIRSEIVSVGEAWINCYKNGGKLLICGNGGSCADSDHIVGELMKGFLSLRPLSAEQKSRMRENCLAVSEEWLNQLQNGLPAISLNSACALNSAFCNDVNPELVYAQQLMGIGNKEDLLVCISTSGNSKNVCAAAIIGKALGIKVISLTGRAGGRLRELSDICICVPEDETYKVQELHLPIYHYLCAETEVYFFEINQKRD